MRTLFRRPPTERRYLAVFRRLARHRLDLRDHRGGKHPQAGQAADGSPARPGPPGRTGRATCSPCSECTSSRAAICVFSSPSAASSPILARTTTAAATYNRGRPLQLGTVSIRQRDLEWRRAAHRDSLQQCATA